MLYAAVAASAGLLAYPGLSSEIRIKAIPLYRFRQFVKKETQFGMGMDDIFYYDKAGPLTDYGSIIDEYDAVPETDMVITRGDMSVYEYTNSIGWSKWLEDIATLSVEDVAINALKDDMARTLDAAAAQPFRNTDLVYTPTGPDIAPTYALVTNGVPAAAASRPCRVWDIKNIVDLMKATYTMPLYDGQNYMCIATTAFIRGLRDDKEWRDAKHYGAPQDLFTGEIGMIAGVRFIEEFHILNNAMTFGGEAIFLSDDCVMEMELSPEEIEAKVSVDYARSTSIRWVWRGGFSEIWDYSTDTEARILRVYEA